MKRLICLVLLCLAVPAIARAQDRAIVVEQAAIYLRPDTSRTPLRTLTPGTELTVIKDQGEWLQVEFKDPQFGTRAGFVQTRLLRRLPPSGTQAPVPNSVPVLPPVDSGSPNAPSPAAVHERSGFAKVGTFVAASDVPNFTLDGKTFDGMTWYKQVNGDEFGILPRLEPKSTMRAIVGYRAPTASFEVSYEQTNHDGTFQGIPGKATFHSLNFDERTFILRRGRIQPYGLVGLSMVWLTVKDGAFLHEQVGDANYRGWGANLEPGVMLFVHPRVGVSVGYRYQPMWFFRASGVSQNDYDLHPKFRETSGNVAITGFFTF